MCLNLLQEREMVYVTGRGGRLKTSGRGSPGSLLIPKGKAGVARNNKTAVRVGLNKLVSAQVFLFFTLLLFF